MEISDSEKLIITMLADLMKHNKVESELDPEFISEAISGGHHWALKWEYSGLFDGQADTEEQLEETLKILEMWTSLEQAYGKLSNVEKKNLETQANLFGKDVKFIGFDGNNEMEYMVIARFLIEKMDRFSNFKDEANSKARVLNSHRQILQVYRGMLKEFLPIQGTLLGRNLTVDEMAQVLKAKAVL